MCNIMSAECDFLRKLDFRSIIDDFLSKKKTPYKKSCKYMVFILS